MKKKRNFLTIISSLFGVAAICGIFACSIIGSKQKEETKAATYTTLASYSTSTYSSYYLPRDNTDTYVECFLYYSIDYVKSYDAQNTSYYFMCTYTFHLYIEYGDDVYNIRPMDSNDYVLTFSSSPTINPLPNGSNFYLFFYGIDRFVSFPASPPFVSYPVSAIEMTLGIKYGINTISTAKIPYGDCRLINDENQVVGDEQLSLVYSYYTTMGSAMTLTYELSDYDSGFSDGYADGYDDGFNNGVTQGYQSGYQVGYDEGLATADSQLQDYYQSGYNAGYNEGFNADSTAITIITGIFQVALVPINFFLGIFNFNILGINLSGFIQALFTIAVTIIVIKMVAGNKGE